MKGTCRYSELGHKLIAHAVQAGQFPACICHLLGNATHSFRENPHNSTPYFRVCLRSVTSEETGRYDLIRFGIR
jgi:hypothetical protein